MISKPIEKIIKLSLKLGKKQLYYKFVLFHVENEKFQKIFKMFFIHFYFFPSMLGAKKCIL